MQNEQFPISIKTLKIIANFDMLILQFALIFEKGLGRGRTGIGGHIPEGK